MPSSRPRRPLVSLEAQLQQLTLFSDLDAENENLEQLGPIIKSLDEARQQDSFLRLLKSFVVQKDQEIEKICDANHSEFISGVDKLLKVRSGTVSLKHRIGELNEDVQAGGSSLANKKKQLLESNRIAANVDEAIETVQSCLRVLDIANRVDTLIQEAKFFSALRSLQELETIYLKQVLHHEFAKHMLDSIPQMRQTIKQSVTSQLKEWLFQVRQNSGTVGKLALESMQHRIKKWKLKSQQYPMYRLSKINSPIELTVNERSEQMNINLLDNNLVSIDFKPLYTCIHIYDVLDLREELQTSYQQDRAAQANLLLSQNLKFTTSEKEEVSSPNHGGATTNTSSAGAGGAGIHFAQLLQEIVGFFLIEWHVLQTAPEGFRNESEVDDLWDSMCTKIVDMVYLGLKNCQDTLVYLDTKKNIQVFIQTLESYSSFSVSKLNKLLLTLFERYANLLQQRFKQDFEQATIESQNNPAGVMMVNDHQELEKVLSVVWINPQEKLELMESVNKSGFPFSLPFSQTYPLCCIDIRNLVDQYYTFSDGFSQHYFREIDEILKKSLDELLIQQVSNGIRNSVQQQKPTTGGSTTSVARNTSGNASSGSGAGAATLTLSQLAQILVNAEYFNLACWELENLLVALRGPKGRGGKLHLNATDHFQTTLDLVENKISLDVSRKLDQFLGLAEYEWTPSHPPSPPTQHNVSGTATAGGVGGLGRDGGGCSGWIQDMLDWLETIMDSVLYVLSAATKRKIYRNCFRHIEQELLQNFLLSKEVVAVNLNGLLGLRRDVEYLIQHSRQHLGIDEEQDQENTSKEVSPTAKQTGVRGKCFGGLQQTLDVFLNDSIPEYVSSISISASVNISSRSISQDQQVIASKYDQIQPTHLLQILDKLLKSLSTTSSAPDQKQILKRNREKESLLKVVSTTNSSNNNAATTSKNLIASTRMRTTQTATATANSTQQGFSLSRR